MCTQIEANHKPHETIGRYALSFASYFIIFTAVLAITADQASAFEAQDPASQSENSEFTSLTSKRPPPSMADSCLPLLKSIHQTTSLSAMDRNQRSAGKATALGVVFGVRFAIGPKETARSNRRNKPRLDIWHHTSVGGDRHALAVSDYRRCQKEKALNALSDFRWKR